MRVLLVSTNRHRTPHPVIPIGGCLIAQATQKAGHKVDFLDLMFQQNPLKALKKRISRFEPEVVGFSIRNIDNTDMSEPRVFYDELEPLVTTVRSFRKAIITVFGGPAVTVMPEALLRVAKPDYAVVGEGELPFETFLTCIGEGRDPRHIDGLAWLEGDRYHANPPVLGTRPASDCVVPDYHRFIDVGQYLSRASTVPVRTKVGCPFECVYCTYPSLEGRRYRLHDPKAIVDEIAAAYDRGLRDFEFVDNVFNAPHDHALAICEELAARKLKARFSTFDINPRLLSDDLLTAMERAGFVAIGISMESASESALAWLKKGYTVEDVRRSAEIVSRHALRCLWITRFGGPGETRATVEETLTFLKRNVSRKDVIFLGIGWRIFPGTELEQIARDSGMLTIPASEMLSPVFYLSPHLDQDWLRTRLHSAAREIVNCLNSDNRPVHPWIERLCYHLGARPPMWQYIHRARQAKRALGLSA